VTSTTVNEDRGLLGFSAMWIGIYIYRHFGSDCYLHRHKLADNYGLLGTLIYKGVKLDGDDSSEHRFFHIFFFTPPK